MVVNTTIKIEDGKVVDSKVVMISEDTNSTPGLYAKFFDEGCAAWTNDPEHNLMFLRHQQLHANDLLKTRGHVFLNEVYDMLGMSRTKAGAIVGWVYDLENPMGDNYIDFGIYNLHNEKTIAFVNGYERSVLLDFNVDGNILERLP